MFKSFAHRLSDNLASVFRGRNLVWHLIFIVFTFFIVVSGLDWYYFVSTRGDLIQSIALPSGLMGFLVPVVLPVVIYVLGEQKKNQNMMRAGSAVAQAEFIALLVSSVYKALTGRVGPEFYTFTSFVDISKDFNFGFWQNGIFWGWPSSHVSVAVAGALCLIMFYPKSKIVKYFGILYIIYMSVAVSISFHWLSDALAGVILGTVVGLSVARGFLSDSV